MKTINHECYVSLKVAKLLKEAGFDWECDFCYQGKKRIPIYNIVSRDSDYYDTPTIYVAQRWLREEKKFILEVEFSNTGYNYFLRYCDVTVHGMSDGHWHNIGNRDGYTTYEDALEDGLKISLTLINTNYGLHREK